MKQLDTKANNNNVGLADLLRRPVVKGLYYNGQALRLDGYCWEGCRFDNCLLEIVSSNFEIRNCVIDSSNKIQYGYEALKPIKLFNSQFPWSYDNFDEAFVPTRADGSDAISI